MCVCVCNYQGSQQVAPFQKLVLVECVGSQHKLRHASSLILPPPSTTQSSWLFTAPPFHFSSLAFRVLKISSSLNIKSEALERNLSQKLTAPNNFSPGSLPLGNALP